MNYLAEGARRVIVFLAKHQEDHFMQGCHGEQHDKENRHRAEQHGTPLRR